MKPIKLTMVAFGPFVDKTEVDFSKLNNQPMFLITGPTGSGKTTILDAITFALYGEASGEDRRSENFKSDYVNLSEKCCVTLEFSIGDKVYKIYRHPRQKKIATKGKNAKAGTASVINSDAMLYMPDENVINGTDKVNQKILDIMGMSYKQFKQIVVLPQGEFKKLLEAPSREKQEIFRQIFDTNLHKIFSETLNNKTKELRIKLDRINTNIKNYIQNLDCHTNEALMNEINQDTPNIAAVLKLLKEYITEEKKIDTDLEKEINNLESEKSKINIAMAKEINQKLERKKFLEEKLLEIEKKNLQYIEKCRILNMSLKAKEISSIERYIEDNKCKQKNLKTRYTLAIEKKTNLERSMLDVSNKLKIVNDNNKKIPDLIRAQAELKTANNLFEQIENLSEQTSLLEKKKILLCSELIKLNKIKSKLELIDKMNLLEKIDLIAQDMKDFMKEYNEIRNIYINKKERYLEHYKNFLNGQAAILADQLLDDKPCPVCGSTHHPNKAILQNDMPSRSYIDDLNSELELIKSKLSSIEKNILNLYNNLKILRNIEFDFENLIQGNSDLIYVLHNHTFDDLNKIRNKINSIDVDCSDYNLDKVTNVIIETENSQLGLDHDLSHKINQLNELVSQVSLVASSAVDISKKLMDISMQITNIEREHEIVNREFLNVKSDLDKSQQEIESLLLEMDSLEISINEYEKSFLQSLKINGFKNKEDYNSYIITEPDLQELQNSVLKFEQIRDRTKHELELLSIEVKDQAPIDIGKITVELEKINEKLSTLRSNQIDIATRLTVNSKQYKLIKIATSENQAILQEYSNMASLSEVSNGDNIYRISFESYVLASHFENVIDAANIRLIKMTNSRYLLKRKQDREKNNRASGLDLEIVDNYTGKIRHVNTLSGGETFKTSLSLALGLADVVQMNSGGVKIDTLFIDEGFGTLDSESLDHAISALTSLKYDGRLVGIISHVNELKERIHTKLVVSPSKYGSVVRWCLS